MPAIARLHPLRDVETAHLRVAYFEAGPADGEPVLLLHGFPYDIHSYVDVAPILAAAGFRVIVPYLRGHGDTRFLDGAIPRTGQQAALGQDVVELMDALRIPQAILAGYDWGGRAACIVAAIQPERVTALVSVNGYLIQDISASMQPIRPDLEAGFWYFFYFLTERGRAGLAENRRGIAEVIWRRNSPDWAFGDAELDRAAAAFENPDYVDVVIHSYRHRLFHAAGAPEYSRLEVQLAHLPAITVPTITLDGLADGNFPARDAATAGVRFTGPYEHRQVPHAGHNLPQEAPLAFADAVTRAAELAARTGSKAR
ncbi:alpha/beta fold hydrolase [Agromyces sp. CFH 90414]|uniref:Alpha/beta fold hydrolase n=1 Tax=Agromyces agglutinans TaxID=2662258 RepID=A0A6I2F7Z9_9MICO|nr:alpha/beta hydrolase [Agromyces agglutinans]MRG60394.1 alpha/beta fold hydrolase [Agromyces agglutinans]